MFTSQSTKYYNIPTKIINRYIKWVDSVDPYYISRIILRKGLYVATLMSFVNMIAKPDVFLAFALPSILGFGAYESYIFNSFFKKEKAFCAVFVIFIIAGAAFYFLIEYKFYLLFSMVAFYSVIYWFIYYHFFEFKPLITMILTFASFMSTILPSSSLQIGGDGFYCAMLGMVTLFFALKTHPNLYHHVWYRATKLYLTHLENTIENFLCQKPYSDYMEEISHINTIRNFKRLLGKKHLLNRIRINFHLRFINLALKHVYLLEKDELFWRLFKQHIYLFRMAMENQTECAIFELKNSPNKNEEFVQKHLNIAINSWNNLCLHH